MNRKISKTNKLLLSIKLFVFLLFSSVFLALNLTGVKAYGSIDTMNSLVMPICGTYILGTSSHVGYYAIDFINSSSPPVYAAGPGKVVLVAYMEGVPGSGYGNYVIIEHTLSNGDKIQTLYAHLASVSVSQGDEVTVTTQVGIMGMSGGGGNGIIHLHFEVRVGGKTVPPDFITNNKRTGDCTPLNPVPTGSPVTPGPTITPLPSSNQETTFDTDLRAYYFNTPNNWNMDSCEKVIVEGPKTDIITDKIKVWKCIGGHSAGNNTIPCSNKWVIAYAETVSIDNFPLLNLLSSSQPTADNLVRPACYYNVTKNITKEVPASDSNGNIIPNQYDEQGMTYTKDYMGLLNLTSIAGKYVNIGYPKLGTAVSCTTLNWDDNNYPPKFDVQLYNKALKDMELKPLGSNVAGASDVKGIFSGLFGDDWWTQIIDSLKNLFMYTTSVKDNESKALHNVTEYNLPAGQTSVCQCSSTNKITRVNESDYVEPLAGAKRVVVNQNKEIQDLTNTQLCDMQYLTGKVIDITGCHMTGSIHDSGEEWVKGSAGASLQSQYPKSYFVWVIDHYDPITGLPIMKCDHGTFCGHDFSCGASVGSMYATCRSGLSVQEYDGAVTGNPRYIIEEKGFDKLTIPGMNKALYNAQVAIEQINSAVDVRYGENIGIRIPATRIMYDLNTQDIAYTPDKTKGLEIDPTSIKSSLKYFISYKKFDYNYRYLNDWNAFTRIGDNLGPNKEIKTDYYFPYIGKLPYLYERVSTINTNEYNSKTAATLLNQSTADELIYDPQIKYCSELTDEQKTQQDCFSNEVCGDTMNDYLERRNLSFFNCVTYPPYTGGQILSPNAPNPPGEPNPPIPSGPPGPTEPPNPTGVPPITVTPGPIPPGPFTCGVISTEADAEAFIATVVAKYPDKLKVMGFKFEGSNGYCDAYGSYIRCDASFAGKSFMTNRLVFHELMHFSRKGIISGGADNPTSELQASIMESVVVSGNCYGGAYSFIGKDNGTRLARSVTSDLLNKGGMSEEQLWDFALGKSDTITPIISKVISGASQFYDLYCRDYGFGDPVSWYGSPIKCSSGSGDSGTKYSNTALVLAASTVGNVSAGYCPVSNGTGPTTTPGAPSTSMNCLIYRTAMDINKSGFKVSPEAIYAILMQETGISCGTTSRETCTGDANQISAKRPGGSYAPLPYTLVLQYPGDDGIGISQAVSWRMYEDIPKYVSVADMQSCMSDIGVNVGDTNPILKDPATNTNITRVRVGDALCYLGLLMKSYNKDFSEADRYNIDKFGDFGLYYNKSSNYVYYLPFFSQAVSGQIFNSCPAN